MRKGSSELGAVLSRFSLLALDKSRPLLAAVRQARELLLAAAGLHQPSRQVPQPLLVRAEASAQLRLLAAARR
jgi:hypothetical protein